MLIINNTKTIYFFNNRRQFTNLLKIQNYAPNMADYKNKHVNILDTVKQNYIKLYISMFFEITDNDVVIKIVKIKMANTI